MWLVIESRVSVPDYFGLINCMCACYIPSVGWIRKITLDRASWV